MPPGTEKTKPPDAQEQWNELRAAVKVLIPRSLNNTATGLRKMRARRFR